MKCHLNVICRKADLNCFEGRTKNFLEYCEAQIEHAETGLYWKNRNCSVINIQFDCHMSEDMKFAVRNFLSRDVFVCIETEEDMEFTVYASMDEIINEGKVFLTLYMKK